MLFIHPPSKHWPVPPPGNSLIAQARSEVVHVQNVGRDQFLAAELEWMIGKTRAEAGISDAILSYTFYFLTVKIQLILSFLHQMKIRPFYICKTCQCLYCQFAFFVFVFYCITF